MQSGIKYESEETSFYQTLQEKTKERLQGLSGKLWTSMYTHDPGLTLNDIINYLLSDLKYKLQFDLEDYLRSIDQPLHASQFGIDKKMLASPATFVGIENFGSLIAEKNPEIIKTEVSLSTHKKQLGCYKIQATINANTPSHEEARIRQMIREQFYQHRNLCEDLEKITLIKADKNLDNTSNENYNFLPADKGEQPFSGGTYRNVYEHIPARMDFPDFYGINDWGLPDESDKKRKIQAEQLKAYLSLFDKVIENGLAELKLLPNILRMDEETVLPENALLKEQFLNNIDKMYGVDSRPSFMLTSNGLPETPKESICRRIRFLSHINFWGRDRNKTSFLNNGNIVCGMEAYLHRLFDLKEGENIRLIEHIFFRHIQEVEENQPDQYGDFPYELSLTVFLYGKTKRMKNSNFKKGLKMAVLKQIPAHLQGNVYWIYNEEADLLDELYRQYVESFELTEEEERHYSFSADAAKQLKEFIFNKIGQ